MTPYLGLRAHDFGILPANELACNIASSGAQCVQLALAKALPTSPMLPADLGEAGMQAVNAAFNDAQLNVAILGCYIDMVCLNLNKREQALQRFEAHLVAAPALGCRIVGTETGSPAPFGKTNEAKEAAFQVAKEGLLRLIHSAEKSWDNGPCVFVGVEPVAEMHAVSSPEHVKRLINAANSPALGIIFDPTNLVPQKGIGNMDTFLDDCFEAFGDRIVAVHAKDYRMLPSASGVIKSGPMPAGEGEMDWHGVFKRLLQAGKQHVPILLEETGPDKASETFTRLNSIARQAWGNSNLQQKSLQTENAQ